MDVFLNYSVDTGSDELSIKDFNVCQDNIAHLILTGKSVTPDNISKSPSRFTSNSAPGSVSIL